MKEGKELNLGIIGYGTRSRLMHERIREFKRGVRLAAVCDIDIEAAKAKLEPMGEELEKIAFHTDPGEMLRKEKLDGVLVGTRCSLHAKLAEKVIRAGIPLYLEKPVSTTREDLELLKSLNSERKSEVVVSFPLRTSPMIRKAKEILLSGKIGKVHQIQAVNNVTYGGVYYHSWYRDDNETKGLFMQKATHDFDYINYLVGVKPVEVCAMTSKSYYRGDKPAGLRCRDCDEYDTCPESPFRSVYFHGDNPAKDGSYDYALGDGCCFAADTGNEDSGSAILRYENGIHACYTQNFIARKGAAARGARLIGDKGTMEFDWYRDEIKVFLHREPVTETYAFHQNAAAHFGGDHFLAWNFIRVMEGTEKSISTLEDGILSAEMCLAAKESVFQGKFVKIPL